MKEKIPLSYRDIQRIKAEEFERFFASRPEYLLYMNHLGEIRWMKQPEALKQHEFFLYSFSTWDSLKKRFRLKRKINLNKLPTAEKEIRLHFRQFLEEKFLGGIHPDTAENLPEQWTYELNRDELKNIPLTLDFSSEAIWKRVTILVAAIALVALFGFFWIWQMDGSHEGKLLAHSNIPSARIYTDGSKFLGYTNKILKNIPEGPHRISVVKEGYSTVPQHMDVEITSDSLVTLNFNLMPLRSEVTGYLKVFGDQPDTKIFVNDRYFGLLSENPVISLANGQHKVSFNKEGFVASPAEKQVDILPGDTSIVNVQMIPVTPKDRSIISGPAGKIGSIAVTSDIKGARIYLNGKYSGDKTDYIFTQLPLGTYSLSIEKEGFETKPGLIEVTLTRMNPSGNASFRLVSREQLVRISANPPKSRIFINGELAGEGNFEGKLTIGDHTVSFGDLPGYKTPASKNITVKAGIPVSISVSYFPLLKISAGISDKGTVSSEKCDVYTGYTLREQAFTSSAEGGPSIEYVDKMQDYFWKLGFAFPYRNPKGNDAVKVTFELPRNMEYEQTFTLEIAAAASREKYPLSLSANTEISIKLNNTILSYYYQPKFIEELNSLPVERWDITPHIRGGLNALEISTTDKNNTYFYLKKIVIYN